MHKRLLISIFLLLCSYSYIFSFSPISLDNNDWYLKKGFKNEWINLPKNKTSKGWITKKGTPIRLNELEKENKTIEYTFITYFKVNLNDIKNMTMLGLYFQSIGENWQIYINGHLLDSQLFLTEDMNVKVNKFTRGLIVTFPNTILKTKNTLTVRIIGKPHYYGTGFNLQSNFRKGYYIDLFKNLKLHHNEFIIKIILGIFLFIFAYHSLLFIQRRSDQYNLYFALASLIIFFYYITQSEFIFIYIKHYNISFDIIEDLELILLLISFPIIIFFIESFLNNKISKASKIIFLIDFILSLYVLWIDRYQWSDLLHFSQVLFIIYLAYLIFNGYKKIIIQKKIIKYLAPAILIIGTTIIDILDTVIFNYGIGLTKYSFILFIASISLSLANKSMKAFNDLDELTEDLDKQVKDRTNELALANDQLKELDISKSNFFANISHELRTPLTLILSPIQSVLQGDYKKDVDDEFLKNLQRNAIRLLTLVNNLLDFAKLEAGRMTLNVSFIDISSFIKKFKENLNLVAESKNITLNFYDKLQKPVSLYFDLDKMDKIIMNLSSNALKFTDKNETIDITLKDNNNSVSIIFKDSGIGIPSDKIGTIFDRFSQADTSSSRSYEGTGIGLALVYELATLHGGTLEVKSNFINEKPHDHGSTFTITIPKGKEHLTGREDVTFMNSENPQREIKDLHATELNILTKTYDDTSERISNITSNHKVLIVEDNKDMRDFLVFLLSDHYNIETAVNGADGLLKTDQLKPDIIITDVMMPVKDGYEMTKELKSNSSSKHIPILMLTAKAELSYKLEGLEFGADDYLTKPFNSKELLTRIKSLLKTSKYETELALRNQEIESELELARLIQNKLFSSETPIIPGYNSYATLIPYDKVGGDFYDLKDMDHLISLFVADSSGHGLASSYLSLIAKIALDSIDRYHSALKVLNFINDYICRSTVKNNFVTSFYGVINKNTNIMEYSSAGHEPQFIYRAETDEIIILKTKGNPLGWFTEIKLEKKEIKLESGDRLILFTDGIIEAQGNKAEIYGDERFYKFIRKNKNLLPKQFSDLLLQELKEYSGFKNFEDDLTLIVFDIE